jgi:hypothetical protein
MTITKMRYLPVTRPLEPARDWFRVEKGYGSVDCVLHDKLAVNTNAGTAAVRWLNGTLQPIVQIQGSPGYLELMNQLSRTKPQTRFPDDIPTTEGKMR